MFNDSAPLNKKAAMPIYGKTLKNLLLQNQESFVSESRYIASRTQLYQVCSNNEPRMKFDLFTTWSLCPCCFGHTGRMASANIQWLSYPGERIVAHGPLVIFVLANRPELDSCLHIITLAQLS